MLPMVHECHVPGLLRVMINSHGLYLQQYYHSLGVFQ